MPLFEALQYAAITINTSNEHSYIGFEKRAFTFNPANSSQLSGAIRRHIHIINTHLPYMLYCVIHWLPMQLRAIRSCNHLTFQAVSYLTLDGRFLLSSVLTSHRRCERPMGHANRIITLTNWISKGHPCHIISRPHLGDRKALVVWRPIVDVTAAVIVRCGNRTSRRSSLLVLLHYRVTIEFQIGNGRLILVSAFGGRPLTVSE